MLCKIGSKIEVRAILGTTSRIIIVPKTSIKDIQTNLIKNTLKVLNELFKFWANAGTKTPPAWTLFQSLS